MNKSEVLDIDEQNDPNSSSNSLMASKVTQFNGAPICTFIYTNDTVSAIGEKVFLPEPIHVSSLNEYDCMLVFPTKFELCKIAAHLQQITQWFGYDVVITCGVIAREKLNENEQGREEPNSSPSLNVTEKILKLPLVLPNNLSSK